MTQVKKKEDISNLEKISVPWWIGIECEWLNISVFWDVMPFCLVKVGRRFGGTYWLHLQGRRSNLVPPRYWPIFCHTARCYLSEDKVMMLLDCGNLVDCGWWHWGFSRRTKCVACHVSRTTESYFASVKYMRRIWEEIWAMRQLHVDLKTAYDSIRREVL